MSTRKQALQHRKRYLKNRKKILRRCHKRYVANRHLLMVAQAAIKFEVLGHYSNSKAPICVRCGFDDIRALSLDHINDDGYLHRRKHKSAGWKLYRWLKLHGYPGGFQTLCMNCQWIKRLEKFPRTGKPSKYPDFDPAA